MPRKPRETSSTGVYHVILRGVNKQRIFEWKEDYDGFFKILRTTMETDSLGRPVEVRNFDLYAYCLMDNHVHLLLREKGAPLSAIVRRIACSYAQRFNLRYQRVGHLFQDRFKSEPCETEAYFLRLLDYIHNNPVKSGVTVSPAEYAYCSYNELLHEPSEGGLCCIEDGFLDMSKKDILRWVKEMPVADLPKTTQKGQTPLCNSKSQGEERSGLLLCNLSENSDEVDQQIVDEILRLSGSPTISAFQQLAKKPMRETLAQLRDAGVSIRRLSRLTGISEGIIRYSKNPKNLL